jgi:hypothetical protein
VSASQRPQPSGTGYVWTAAELARAKELRREGYTHGTIAGLLREEYGTGRSGDGVRKLFLNLRQRGVVVETVAEHERVAAREKHRATELARANLVRRKCLRCSGGFDSYGPQNRVCSDCKASEAWR